MLVASSRHSSRKHSRGGRVTHAHTGGKVSHHSVRSHTGGARRKSRRSTKGGAVKRKSKKDPRSPTNLRSNRANVNNS